VHANQGDELAGGVDVVARFVSENHGRAAHVPESVLGQ
jgi:hypothetical protein